MANTFLDIGSNALVGESFTPAALTTTTNGTGIDLSDSNANMASALLNVGAVSGTQGTLNVKIQESTDNTTFVDITGATFAQQTTSGTAGSLGSANGSQIISFQRNKRYVRAYATMAGTFTNFLFGVTIFSQMNAMPLANGGWINESGGS